MFLPGECPRQRTWWATVPWVTKIRTRLKWLSMHTHKAEFCQCYTLYLEREESMKLLFPRISAPYKVGTMRKIPQVRNSPPPPTSLLKLAWVCHLADFLFVCCLISQVFALVFILGCLLNNHLFVEGKNIWISEIETLQAQSPHLQTLKVLDLMHWCSALVACWNPLASFKTALRPGFNLPRWWFH